MNYKVNINNQFEFYSDGKKSVLELLYNNKINVNYSCKSGRCRSCIAKVVKGKIADIYDSNILSENEKNEGIFLTCNSYPNSDLNLDIKVIDFKTYIEPTTVPVKIDSINTLYKSVSEFILRVPPSQEINFNPGQYLDLIKGDLRRSYSFYNSLDYASNQKKIKLIIKRYEKGQMSNVLFNNAKIGDLLRIEFPKGTFYLRDEDVDNIIFLATGTGIAPFKSILSSKCNFNILKKINNIILLWGQKKHSEFFQIENNLFSKTKIYKIASREKNFNKNTTIRHVQDFMFNLDLNFSRTAIYACGNINMIQETSNKLDKINFDMNRFYSDAFVQSNTIK